MSGIQPENALVSKIEISISCRHLKGEDLVSKSDPFAVLSENNGNHYEEIGRTETVKNNHDPVFSEKFNLNYYFEKRQLLKVDIYDSDSSSLNLADHDYLGYFEFSLGQLVSKKVWETDLITKHKIKNDKPQQLILSCIEISDSKDILIMSINGSKLDKKDTFGKSDPFLEFYRFNNDVKYDPANQFNYDELNFTLVHRTNYLSNTLNPSWPKIEIKKSRLCLGDDQRLIKVVCHDYDNDGSHDLIGQFYTSVNDMFNNQAKQSFYKLINPKKQKKKKNYEDSGTITINKIQSVVEYSFFDFISGGTELHFTVAIDFTGSNGAPTNPTSLHFISDINTMGFTNQYENAIWSVGSIIQDYDDDKAFPSLGFGARIPPNNEVSHCFPITFMPNDPFSYGIDGLLQNYRKAIKMVQLYGPTNFSPCIRHVESFARQDLSGSKYFVLLILTDGIITDFDETLDAIIDCSNLPVSLIIIGVGNEDFSAMDALDCDNGRLKFRNKVAVRDIVQFVPIREYMDQSNMVNHDALNKAVLKELPKQLTDWMKSRGIKPLPRKTSNPLVPPPGIPPGQPGCEPPYPMPGLGGTGAPYPPQGDTQAPYPMQQMPYPGQESN